ncbi:SUMF1/EgtB/PvdO family nonheme iron enzyme [uncultured Fluviicola sp.]|uniref:formylglycine-generating enzyme family protein n=1 Tax=uncultured Fluviicola sp. TaxID=463303 RepID=UPI0025EDC783|nr:SUMF1/EgtB/PvdO family nonheme iron enzyme [uncultured Fluviicola sp.]
MKIFFGILTLAILFSCSTARKFQKTRSKNGNDLTFVYFKKGEASKDPYHQILGFRYPKEIDSMTAFYWGGQTEVTNKQYLKFVAYLKVSDSLGYEKHKPKTFNWRAYSEDFDFADSMARNYDNLEAFGNHPVVNITPENATAFVTWLNKIEPDSLVFYRLFKPFEWLELFNEKKEIDSSFAWEGNYWRNKNQLPLANYAEFDQDQIRYNHLTDRITFQNSDSVGYESYVNGPMNVWSYNPNYWGAWNMSGNVAEITESYYKLDSTWYCTTRGGSWHSPVFYLRKSSTETYKLPSPYVGFRVLKIQLKLRED